MSTYDPRGWGQPPRQHQQPPAKTPRRQAPGNLAGTAIACLLLGLVLGGAGMYFLGPTRTSAGAPAPAVLVESARQALPGDQGQPKTEQAVRAAAQEWGDRYAAGDYGGSWDMWVAAAKREFSRDDYVRLHELCPDAGAGLRFSVDAVDYTQGADVASVRMSRLIGTWTYEFHYQDGGWKAMPLEENLALYREHKTGEALAAAHRAEGSCGES